MSNGIARFFFQNLWIGQCRMLEQNDDEYFDIFETCARLFGNLSLIFQWLDLPRSHGSLLNHYIIKIIQQNLEYFISEWKNYESKLLSMGVKQQANDCKYFLGGFCSTIRWFQAVFSQEVTVFEFSAVFSDVSKICCLLLQASLEFIRRFLIQITNFSTLVNICLWFHRTSMYF